MTLGRVIKRSEPLTAAEKAIILWYAIDALTHLLLELPWVLLTVTTTVDKSTHWISIPWKEYARADPRWGRVHDCTLALEIPTALLWGPLAAALAYATYYRRPWRHFWQVVCASGEIYGNWMTFAPEWLTGSAALNPENSWVHKWVYLFYANIVWIIIPFILLVESCSVITDACDRSKSHRRAEKTIGALEVAVIYATLGLFGVVVAYYGIIKHVA